MPLILPRRPLESTLERTVTKRRSGIPIPLKSGLCHASKPNTNTILTTPAKRLPPCIRHKSSPDPEIPYLELVPFGRQPTVNFGSVRVGQTKLKYVVIRNIEQMQKQVFVKSFPKKAKGFDIDATEFLLAPRTEILITLAWTPTIVGSIRETISFQDVSRMPSRIILVGESIRSDARSTRITKRISPKKIEQRRLIENTKRPPLTRLSFPARRRQSSQLVARIKKHQEGPSAALIIQTNWRRVLAQKELARLRAERQRAIEIRSATCIQANWRRFLAERELATLKAHRQILSKAALIIQTNWRRVLAQKELAHLKAERQHAMEIRSATCIQANWRRFLAERELATLKARRQMISRAALIIQTNWRRVLSQRELAMLRTERQYAIKIRSTICIQANWRRVLAQKELATLKAHRRMLSRAALIIQTNWKRVLAQKELARLRAERRHVIETMSATCIQANWRRVLAQKELATLKAHRRMISKAALIIQTNWRRVLAQKELATLKARRQILSKAALIIQTNWRRVLAQKELAHLKAERQHAMEIRSATCIQANWRIFLAKKELARLRAQRLALERLVTYFQTYCRGFLFRRRLARSIEAVQNSQRIANKLTSG